MIQLKAIWNQNCPINISVTTTQDTEMWNCSSYLLHCLFFLSWVFLHNVDRLHQVKCHYRFLFLFVLFHHSLPFFVLQNVVMQLWTLCLFFIGLHWYYEYPQKVSSNCICYSCTCRCVANEIEFCCSCFLGAVLLKLSFMVFYRSLNVIVRHGNVLDAEWTRSQLFHSSVTEWSCLEWRMRGVILRPDRVPRFLSLCSK